MRSEARVLSAEYVNTLRLNKVLVVPVKFIPYEAVYPLIAVNVDRVFTVFDCWQRVWLVLIQWEVDNGSRPLGVPCHILIIQVNIF